MEKLAKQTLFHGEARHASRSVTAMLAANEQVFASIRALAPLARQSAVMTFARGSSENACLYGRYLIESRLGIRCSSAPLSIGSLYDAPIAAAGGLCIAVSQSGASPDLLAAVTRARRGGAVVIGLVNDRHAPLVDLCDLVVTLEAHPEQCVAATKSCLSAMAAMARISAEWAGDAVLIDAIHALPEMLDTAWAQDWTPLVDRLAGAGHLYVLGRGCGLGVAQEAALKLKETCGLHAEAFSTAEAVHGPLALAGADLPVLIFAQRDETLSSSIAVAERFAASGSTVFCAGTCAAGAHELASLNASPGLQPIVLAQSFYRAVDSLASARGCDPDRPRHITKITRTH